MFLNLSLPNIHTVLLLSLQSNYLPINNIYRLTSTNRRNLIFNKIKMSRNFAVAKEQQNLNGPSNNIVKSWKWDINEIMNGQDDKKYAILILNSKITQNKNLINHCWNKASLRITVDGGTTHWDRFLNNLSEEEQKTMRNPDLVTGDFDSILEEVLQKYEKKHCKIINTPDQNYTDFTKAVMELNNYCIQNNVQMDYTLVISRNSGRLDQILGNIQTLHLIKENNLLHDRTKVYIMSDNSLTWLLYPGDHIIEIPIECRKTKGVWCSLIPIGEPCESVTTSGLKWNLDNQCLKFGDLISTSNTFDGSEQVKVKCSNTLLWSMKVPSLTL